MFQNNLLHYHLIKFNLWNIILGIIFKNEESFKTAEKKQRRLNFHHCNCYENIYATKPIKYS